MRKPSTRYISWLPLTVPQPGTWRASQACALTGNQTCNVPVYRMALSALSHTSQGSLFLTFNGLIKGHALLLIVHIIFLEYHELFLFCRVFSFFILGKFYCIMSLNISLEQKSHFKNIMVFFWIIFSNIYINILICMLSHVYNILPNCSSSLPFLSTFT